jgi:predicted dehydrogenase
MAETLRWGILGLGGIARRFAEGLPQSRTGRLAAVASRDPAKAEAFGAEFGAPRRHGSYEALLADPEVEAVYIALPHPLHAAWAVRAAEAGKHILCEKPLTVNHAEAATVVEAARRHDVFLMEAFMYRCHPQIRRLVELLRDGAIGEVRAVRAAFSFDAGFNPDGRLLAKAMGGGGILDVGCYPVSLVRLVAGAAQGKDFADPIEVKGCAHLGSTGVDEWAAAVMRFPGGLVAEVSTGVRVARDTIAQIYGSEGWIALPEPWTPRREKGVARLLVQMKGQDRPEELRVESSDSLYALEADVAAAHLDRRQAPPPSLSWDDSLGNMRTMDRWRESVGLEYDADRQG